MSERVTFTIDGALAGARKYPPGTERVRLWNGLFPGAVLISIIAPIVVGDPAGLMGVLAAAVVGVRTGNVLLTMLIGIGVVWALCYLT